MTSYKTNRVQSNDDLHTVYLGLGTNLGDREANMRLALRLIGERVGTVEACSKLHFTEPWGFVSDNEFANAVARVATTLSAQGVLEATQGIERDMGRTEKSVEGQYHDRIIDIDILLFGNNKITAPGLEIPHPLMLKRDFVMLPLREVLDAEGRNFLEKLIEGGQNQS